MKILVIGDQQLTGFGLPDGQLCFVGQFVRQISRAGQAVTVEAYPQISLPGCQALLMQLPLERYDLIIWQSGQHVEPPVMPKPVSRLTDAARWLMEGVRNRLGYPDRQSADAAGVGAMLRLLRPQRHKVLIMTPTFPPDGTPDRWLKRIRHTLLQEGYRQGFSVFDTSRHVRPRPEYFLTRFPNRLNAVSHELIGRALFDFYQATPTIVAIRSKD